MVCELRAARPGIAMQHARNDLGWGLTLMIARQSS